MPINTKLVTKCEHKHKRYTHSSNLILRLSSYYHLHETQTGGPCLYLDHMDLVRLLLPLSTTDPHPKLHYGETTHLITQAEACKPPWKTRIRWRGHHSGFLTSRTCHRYLLHQYSFIWGGENPSVLLSCTPPYS